MNAHIRYPNITAGSESEQLAQIKKYLRTLADELNYILNAQMDARYATREELKNIVDAISALDADT